MARLVNLTGKPVTLTLGDGRRVRIDPNLDRTVPEIPGGRPVLEMGEVGINDSAVPVCRYGRADVEGLPDRVIGVAYIVTEDVCEAARRSDLVYVGPPVDGRTRLMMASQR